MKHLNFILAKDEEESAEFLDAIGEQDEITTHPSQKLNVSLCAISELMKRKIIVLCGELMGERVSLLVDTGSTTSFLNHKTIQTLGMTYEIAPPLTATIASGSTVTSFDICSHTSWKIQGHKFTFSRYKKGIENGAADALSRRQENIQSELACPISCVRPGWLQEIILSYEGDDFYQQLIAKLLIDSAGLPDYTYSSELLKFNGKIVVRTGVGLRKKHIAEFAHFSYRRTFWPACYLAENKSFVLLPQSQKGCDYICTIL
ncbi:hypothetical protein ACH5RR_026944 [Cinchona calisaya]|uniref:Peptidase A2 domain-containing protein n=1 Tax=Cinchona calisaya TaxID=153742 RepID=A0ABD2Z418_9GENT